MAAPARLADAARAVLQLARASAVGAPTAAAALPVSPKTSSQKAPGDTDSLVDTGHPFRQGIRTA
jgi:hypothetical protein